MAVHGIPGSLATPLCKEHLVDNEGEPIIRVYAEGGLDTYQINLKTTCRSSTSAVASSRLFSPELSGITSFCMQFSVTRLDMRHGQSRNIRVICEALSLNL